MIEVKNITKIYGRGKKRVVALDNVSFVLPDKGMVFVVGKSGCGKSTLLNIIGGCDKLSAGDIVMDGNSFSAFRERDFDNFRNDYVGFVFQDYCLLDGLTVWQNIALALQLKGERDDNVVRDALDKVRLADCADRRPDELSGGQKQRVAIARTLVKSPKLILADEPTGNLDEKSSRIILDILKELSQNVLVVIVSHNRPDAERYADRIIELSDGKIVGDVSRNKEAKDVSFDGSAIVIQKGTTLSEQQLADINEKLRKGGVCIQQTDAKFLPTAPPAPTSEKRDFPSHRLSLQGARTLFGMFAKKRVVSTLFTAISIIIFVVIMGICQLFTQFSPDAEIARLLAQESKSDALIMQKGYKTNEFATNVSTDRMVRARDDDIAAFRATGYKGGIYPLYNVSVMAFSLEPAVWDVEGYHVPSDALNYEKFYCGSALGVLVTNEDYLARIYGADGKLTLLSGTLETKEDEIIVTDYFADSILASNLSFTSVTPDKYAKITTGEILFERYRVAGVIATGYKQRYRELLDAMISGGSTKNLFTDAYSRLRDELNSTLNIAYSFNPDFAEAYLTDDGITRAVYYGTYLVSDGTNYVESCNYCYPSKDLKPGEVIMSRTLYAQLMQIDESQVDDAEATGKKITLTRYENVPQGEAPDYTMQVTIAGLMKKETWTGDFRFAQPEYMQAMKFGSIPYALYFDDLSNITALYDKSAELNFVVKSPLVSAIYTVARAAFVFKDMFKFIVGIMLLIIVLALIAFGVGSVRKNMYEIAVVRALGGKAGDLAGMFVLQMFIVSIVVCVASVVGLAIGAKLCNSLLGDGFVKFAHNSLMSQLHIVAFDWGTALIDAGIILLLTVIAAVVPFAIMRRAKPREIIRAKE